MSNCFCGSGIAFSQCCEPALTGTQPAATAEGLMRARYSAYVAVNTGFIFETTHPDNRKDFDRKGTKEWAESAEWEGLEIIDVQQGGKEDTIGDVEFVARYRVKGTLREHHELAHFRKENGRWFFMDGSMVKPKPIIAEKIGRNYPCPCGSGAKYKKCCGK